MYTMTLNDGTEIKDLTIKNNCLVSDKPLTLEMFRGKLNPVTISGTKGEYDDEDWGRIVGEHAHMEVCYIRNIDGKYALALNDIPNDRWKFEQLRADVDFTAMMTGVKL